MNILTIIPARAGSKGIISKNIFPLCGRPLIDWTYEAAIHSNSQKVIVSSDDAELCRKYVHGYYRPDYLAQNDTPMIDVIKYHLYVERFYGWDAVMILQPTSPLRTADDINRAIEIFKLSGASSLYSGYYMGIKNKNKVYDKHTSEKHFQRNGAIFIATKELIECGKLWIGNAVEFEMPFSRSIDIDSMDDMKMAEALMKYRIQGGQI